MRNGFLADPGIRAALRRGRQELAAGVAVCIITGVAILLVPTLPDIIAWSVQ